MRAPSSGRTRRYPVVDEIDNPNILPPLDRPFDSLLTTRSRLRTEDPLTRRLLTHGNQPNSSPISLLFRNTNRSATRERKICEDVSSPSLIRVEMLSCDGGSLDFDESGRYNAENLLQDNVSVYCTAKLENVNILLRGAGSRPFTLSRIEIKAPQRSFTSPVKDGLIFVSMDRINVNDTRIFDRPHQPDEDTMEDECADEDDDASVGSEPMHSMAAYLSTITAAAAGSSNLERLIQGRPLSQSTTDLYDRMNASKEILRPSAYFTVDETTGSATVTFNPPISGRYVHVKLLSGQPFDNYPGRFERDNIDIQAILLYGYGRRVFPSCQLR